MIGPWLHNSLDALHAEIERQKTRADAADARMLQLVAQCAFMAGTDTKDTTENARRQLVARVEAAEAEIEALQRVLPDNPRRGVEMLDKVTALVVQHQHDNQRVVVAFNEAREQRARAEAAESKLDRLGNGAWRDHPRGCRCTMCTLCRNRKTKVVGR